MPKPGSEDYGVQLFCLFIAAPLWALISTVRSILFDQLLETSIAGSVFEIAGFGFVGWLMLVFVPKRINSKTKKRLNTTRTAFAYRQVQGLHNVGVSLVWFVALFVLFAIFYNLIPVIVTSNASEYIFVWTWRPLFASMVVAAHILSTILYESLFIGNTMSSDNSRP